MVKVGVAQRLIPPHPDPLPHWGRGRKKVVGSAHPTLKLHCINKVHKAGRLTTRNDGSHRPPYEGNISIAISWGANPP